MIWSTVCRFCFISKNPFRVFSPVKILSLAVDQLKGGRPVAEGESGLWHVSGASGEVGIGESGSDRMRPS